MNATDEKEYENLPPHGADSQGTVRLEEHILAELREKSPKLADRLEDTDSVARHMREVYLRNIPLCRARERIAPKAARKVVVEGYSVQDALDFAYYDLVGRDRIHPDDAAALVTMARRPAERKIVELRERMETAGD